MNALEKHLQDQQDAAAALEAITRCIRAIAPRKEVLVEDLVIDLSELAVMISTDMNRALDTVNLPKGVLA